MAIPTYKQKPHSVPNDVVAASQQMVMESTSDKIQSKSRDDVISFKEVNISLSIDTEPMLKNLTLDIKRGLAVIIGPVGSGKSALIAGHFGRESS